MIGSLRQPLFYAWFIWVCSISIQNVVIGHNGVRDGFSNHFE